MNIHCGMGNLEYTGTTFSEDTAKLIDQEINAMIAEQYDRAKRILLEQATGHASLTKVLEEREVIFTEDVERIFGPRQWASRTEELLEANTESKADPLADTPTSEENKD